MARNKLSDLNNHLFAQLEKLGDDELVGDELKQEIHRAKAITGISREIIESSKTVLEAATLVSKGNIRSDMIPDNFGLDKTKSIEEG